MRLIDFVFPELVFLDLTATTRDGVIQEMLDRLAAAGVLDSTDVPTVLKHIRRFEDHGFGGHMHGVARPQAKGPLIHRRCVAIGITRSPVPDFDAIDGIHVDIIALMCLPVPRTHGNYARMNLAAEALVEWTLLSSRLQDTAELRDRLRKARSREEVVALIAASPVEAPAEYTEPDGT